MLLEVLVYAVPLLVVYVLIKYYRWVGCYPKGPTPWPLIGNFHQLDAPRLHEDIARLAKEHGPVFTIFLPAPMVVITGYEAFKEAMLAKENRRVAIHILRDFGMGKNRMEEQVMSSVRDYLQCLEGIEDKENVDMRWPIQDMIANIINETLFGYRYAYDDCKPLMDYVETFNEALKKLGSPLIRYLPAALQKIPAVKYYTTDRHVPMMSRLNDYIINGVAKAMETYSPDSEPECFVHAYKQKMESGASEYINQEQLYAVCSDFFLAGQETTTTTLRWAMLLLASNQRVQDKLRSEILSVVGRDRLPTMFDKPRMPYTKATALEIQRRANILQTVQKRTLVDTEVMGFKIPKDTMIDADLHHVLHHDPLFQNPMEFIPERYLNEDGRTLNKEVVDRTVPFGLGRRQCAGEGLARVEIFLGLAATVQTYRIEPLANRTIDLGPQLFNILLPKQQSVKGNHAEISGVYALIKYYRWVGRYPKGPTPWPLIGNVHQLDFPRFHEDIARLAEEHGPVFTIFLPIPMVVIIGYEAFREAMITKGDDFAGRPVSRAQAEFFFTENPGVIRSNGPSWRENRRAAIHILRDFGMGKNRMEEQVMSSVRDYLQCLDGIKDKDNVDMRWPIQVMIANIINDTLFGYRYAYDDCKPLMDYVETFNEALKKIGSPLIRFIPAALLKIPAVKYYVTDRHIPMMSKLNDYIINGVETAMKTYSPDSEPECFVHAYKLKMETTDIEYICQDQLYAVCADFFLAGQETTTTTLRWAMLFLANNQRDQDKLRAEILSVVGRDRLPTMADKPRMPYTTATAMEIQRRANILQTSVPRRTVVDTEVMGFKIPKNTMIDADLHHMLHHDPLFEDPMELRPERFLNADGRTLNKEAVDRSMPFGLGRRQCAGEGLARVELFLGLAATVQAYRIEPPSSGKTVDLEPQLFGIMLPKQQSVRLVPI